jgi:hypothetical protein
MLNVILLVLIPIVIAELCMRVWWGDARRRIVCPECGISGKVRVKQVKQMAEPPSGAAEISIGNWSMLATRLLRRAMVIQAHCSRCGMTWHPGAMNQPKE